MVKLFYVKSPKKHLMKPHAPHSLCSPLFEVGRDSFRTIWRGRCPCSPYRRWSSGQRQEQLRCLSASGFRSYFCLRLRDVSGYPLRCAKLKRIHHRMAHRFCSFWWRVDWWVSCPQKIPDASKWCLFRCRRLWCLHRPSRPKIVRCEQRRSFHSRLLRRQLCVASANFALSELFLSVNWIFLDDVLGLFRCYRPIWNQVYVICINFVLAQICVDSTFFIFLRYRSTSYQ